MNRHPLLFVAAPLFLIVGCTIAPESPNDPELGGQALEVDPLASCRGEGVSCTNASQCCSGRCNGDGVCSSPGGGACRGEGAACSSSHQCCGGFCNSNGICHQIGGGECRGEGVGCSHSYECCSNFCNSENQCHFIGGGGECGLVGDACNSSMDCCEYIYCDVDRHRCKHM